MCGIAGILSTSDVDKIDVRIQRMCDAMQYRGPDAGGIACISKSVAFGHRRLSIIDLCDRSNQPMFDSNNRYCLCYNGELINFKTIREKLHYPFQTTSDTEVFLAAISEKGISWLLGQASGMFAFSVYDTWESKLYLGRDPFGIKPLLYTKIGQTIVFASEMNSLLSSGLVEAKLNECAVDDYFGYRYVREPDTMISNVKSVRSGTYLEIDAKANIVEHSYYSLPKMNFQEKYDEKELIEALDANLNHVMEEWVVADVRVGSYLSGGLDSSLLTALMSQRAKNLDTFTIGFDDKLSNEFVYATEVANLYKTNHHELLIEIADYRAQENRLINIKGAPLGVPNEIPLAIMTSSLKKDVTMVISGEGADELFGGYGRIFRSPFDYDNLQQPKNSFFDYFIDAYEYTPRKFRDKYLSGCLTGYRNQQDNTTRQEFAEYRSEENVFRFFHNTHIKGLLTRLDACTMQASVESRPPFLDKNLVSFVYSNIPYELKLKWKSPQSTYNASSTMAQEYSEILDTPKYILKRMAENYLPLDIVYRKKMGFPIPLTENLESLLTTAKSILPFSPWIKAYGDKFYEDIYKLKNPGHTVWMFINMQLFYQTYIQQEWRY